MSDATINSKNKIDLLLNDPISAGEFQKKLKS